MSLSKRALFYSSRNFIGQPFVVEQQFQYPAGLIDRKRYKSLVIEDGIYLCAYEVKDPVYVKKHKQSGKPTILKPGRYSDLLTLGDFSHFRVVDEDCLHYIDIGFQINNQLPQHDEIEEKEIEKELLSDLNEKLVLESQTAATTTIPITESSPTSIVTLDETKKTKNQENIDQQYFSITFSGSKLSQDSNNNIINNGNIVKIIASNNSSDLKQYSLNKQLQNSTTNSNEFLVNFTISKENVDYEKGSLLIKYNENSGFYSVVKTTEQTPSLDIQQIGRTRFIFLFNPKISVVN